MAYRNDGDTPCKCRSKDFLNYLSDEDGLLGFLCSTCGREWLREQFLNNSDSDEFIRFRGNVYLLNKRRQARDDQYVVQYNRTKLSNLDYAVDALKPSNHIQWEKKLYDHHGIVENVNVKDKTIDVIEYQPGKGYWEVKVIRHTITLDSTKISNLYRIDYDETEADPCNLILARARAWLGQARYNMFTRNCETFSVYCVVGSLVSWQTISLASKLTRCIRASLTKTCYKTATAVAIGEIVESASTGAALSNMVGAGIVIAVEGTAVVFDVKTLYAQRQKGGLSRKDFLQNTIKRIIEGLIMAGFVVGGSIGVEIVGGILGTLIYPGVGTFLGMFIGSIIGGVVMGVTGEICGTFFGRCFGKAIAATVKTDDRYVRFKDLKRGDQIVMCAWFLHPRCHAIVTDINRDKRTITVIRKTHSKGVIREVLDFVPPVYRVSYTGSQRHTAEDTIRRAESKLGEKKYNILSNNCKHFASWCIKNT